MANTTRRNFTKSLIISALATSFPSTVLQSKQSKAIFQKKAKRLRPNDTVGIVAPCSKLAAGKLDEAIEKIKNLGLKVKLGNHVSKKNGYLAGTDAQRLDDIHRMFADPTVSAVWSVRGGYGSSRILPKLDYSLIRKNPKILIGYSDMTALLQAVYKKTGLVGFHGPMGTSTFNDYVVEHFKKIIMNPQPQLVINYAEANSSNEDPLFKTHAIRDGVAKGKLMGGNLTLLAALAGTPYDFNFRNKLVFLEDIGEKPYRIDRMLTQLMQSSNLDEASGIVLGVFTKCETDDPENSWKLSDTLKDRLAKLKIPVVYGASFGHIKNNLMLPIGIQAQLNTRNHTLTLLEQAVV